jgi:hypothetical protein
VLVSAASRSAAALDSLVAASSARSACAAAAACRNPTAPHIRGPSVAVVSVLVLWVL